MNVTKFCEQSEYYHGYPNAKKTLSKREIILGRITINLLANNLEINCMELYKDV